ncbi:MAG: tRNA lysidine(34) synthetase TilS [Gemmatimonadaceae bacterium]
MGPRRRDAAAQVIDAVRQALEGVPRALIAVSGGRDSMVLLEAMARVAPARVASVATFDHGTGGAAARAAQLVVERAHDAGFQERVGRSVVPVTTEAAWRAQRFEFLLGVAADLNARIVTAHTLDDQLETVLMRALRHAGARGLAGLLAPSAIVRPFLGLPRATIAACAASWRVPFIDDPSNASRAHLRNRVRLDLLPALGRARSSLSRELLALGRRAADLRRELEAFIDANIDIAAEGDTVVVSRDDLAPFEPAGLALLWPALAARHGVTLDRRGTERLTSFTINAGTGARIQLSGGAEALRHRDRLLLRRVPIHAGPLEPLTLEPGTTWGRWRFVQGTSVADSWSASLPVDRPWRVRTWRPGDRMIPEGSTTPRRLKGLFRDAGVDAVRRRQWPVVEAGSEIVWVPGVRRALAAAARSGRPNVTFRCEHIDR